MRKFQWTNPNICRRNNERPLSRWYTEQSEGKSFEFSRLNRERVTESCRIWFQAVQLWKGIFHLGGQRETGNGSHLT
jgi:hypothetical protein